MRMAVNMPVSASGQMEEIYGTAVKYSHRKAVVHIIPN